MRKINLSLICLFSFLFAFGQEGDLERSSEVKLTKSDPYPVVDALSKQYYSIDSDHVLGVKIQGKKQNKFVFQIFGGENLSLQSTVTELMEEKGFNFEYIIELNKKMYFFYSIYDKPNTTEQLFVRELDLAKGGFATEGQLLLSVPQKISGSYYYRYSAQGKFRIDVSNDKETFVIKYRLNPQEKDDSKNTDIIGMHVFSSGLEKIWGENVTMPYTESMMDNLDFAVDSKGTGYFFVRKYKEEVTRKNREDANNASYAFLITNADGTLNEVEFSIGDNIMSSVFMKENKLGDIICAGYYRKPKSYGIDGTFVSVLTSKGELSEPKFYEFSLDFIKKYKKISERGKKKLEKADEEGELSLANLSMTSVSVLEDGGIALAGEIFYVTCTTDSKGNTRCVNHYDDVIVVKINADGTLGWMQKFPKRSTFESFRMFNSEKYTYIVFSDNPKNADIPEDRGPYMCTMKERQVIAYRTDNQTGERKHLALFGFKQIDGTPVYQYSLNRVIPLTENSFAVEMYIKSKSDMMFKVEFEE